MFRKYFIFIRQFINRINEDNISAFSAQVAYYILLSFFPFIMFLLTVINYTPLTQADVISQLSEIFPTQVSVILMSILTDISGKTSNALLPITIIATLWSASRGIMFVIKGLNQAHRINETRNYFLLRFIATIYTIVFALIIIITLILLVFGNKILLIATSYITIPIDQVQILNFVRITISIGVLLVFFVFIYNLIPNKKIRIADVIPGAFFSSISWILISFVFSIYIDNMDGLSYMYGSLTGIIILMLWLYICSNIIMIGGELNAYIIELKNKNQA